MKNKDILAVLILIAAVLIFTCPLTIRIDGAFDLFPKNSPRAGNYFDLGMINKVFFLHHQLPLWDPQFEGGSCLFGHPADTFLNPVSTFLLGIFRNEVVVDNLTWVVFYILGSCSMYYFCRVVLCFNISGAFLASVVFSMNGLFPYLQENGFSQARSVLLLPLLVGFIFKAKERMKYSIYASMLLAFIAMEASLFVPVIILFLFFLVLIDSVQYQNNKFKIEIRSLRMLLLVISLAFLLSCIKMVPLLSSFGAQIRPEGLPYDDYIISPNTLDMFITRLLAPINSWPGMYVGAVPVTLCVLASILFFKRMRLYIICLILAIWFSFGQNAYFDLHKIFWHLPLFHEMREISKYYGLLIVFCVSILSGSFLVFLDKYQNLIIKKIFSLVVILYIFTNLVWSNIGYFNSFNTILGDLTKTERGDFFHVTILNGHPGDESISTPLSYFLYKKNIGLVNQYFPFKELTSISPKYFLLPRYALLMPYTSLLVIPNPEYKGEVFLLNPKSSLKIIKFSPIEIIVDVKMHAPDRLILNQNYDKGWKSSAGVIEEYNNLLSVRFDQVINKRITISYLPVTFILGFIISMCAFAGAVIYLVRMGNKCAL